MMQKLSFSHSYIPSISSSLFDEAMPEMHGTTQNNLQMKDFRYGNDSPLNKLHRKSLRLHNVAHRKQMQVNLWAV
jgi:hypothetical protein